MKQWFLLLMSLAGIASSLAAAEARVKVTTTVSMVTDLVKQVGGDRVEVQGLMGAGVDPHLYKATAADVSKLRQADVVFYSGLLLEGKMQEVLTTLAKAGRRVHAITGSIPEARLTTPPEFQGHHDPHVWFDVSMWRQCVPALVKGLVEADPAGRADYEKRGADVEKKLQKLHDWALKKAAELASEKRILVTSHDAYNYFGRAYGFQVVGLQGISTVTEASLSDVVKLVDFIKAKKIKAIFVESSVPHNTIERISKDAGVKIGGELFSDAMGTPGQIENGYDLGTYEGMIKHNLHTIVEALK